MNDDNDGVVKCQKNSTTPPRQSPVLRFHTSQQKYNCQIQAVAIPGKRASVTVIQAYHHGLLSGILSSYVDS